MMSVLVHIFLENFFLVGLGSGHKCLVYERTAGVGTGTSTVTEPKRTRTGMGKNVCGVISGTEAKVREGLEGENIKMPHKKVPEGHI